MKATKVTERVYCIGLGGVGVSAVAKLLLARGIAVSGSDPVKSPLVEEAIKQGAIYYQQPDGKRITKNIDLLVYTDDAPVNHPERMAAKRLNIATENFSATLGRIMKQYRRRITIAGTNGKSTTTALTGILLAEAGLDPTVFVGSRASEFAGNIRYGGSELFVAEADEYRDHFLNYAPTTAVINNIELDHVDYFGDLPTVINSFKQYADLLPADGHLIINRDNQILREHFFGRSNVVTYGTKHPADLVAEQIDQHSGGQTFSLIWRNQMLGQMAIHLPGIINIENALGAMAAALMQGADPGTFAQTIGRFKGIWRRFQILNATAKTIIINDYAHHPTAVRETLIGAKKFYPDRRMVAVFQPHHHNRLTRLFDDFTRSFGLADEIVIVEVYKVPGREPQIEDNKTSQDLADALKQTGAKVHYAADPEQAEKIIKTILRPKDAAIIMGAGDIWQTAEKLGKYYA